MVYSYMFLFNFQSTEMECYHAHLSTHLNKLLKELFIPFFILFIMIIIMPGIVKID